MPQNVTGLGTTFNLPNYSGELATASVTQTPFLSMVLAKGIKTVNALEFPTMSDYTLPDPESDGISENAAADITANKTATNIVRGQSTNIIQTFTDLLSISYLKQATNGQMSGLNIAGQTNNAPSELDFQRSMILKKNARNIEHAFLNGTYKKAANANEANKMRGMFEAIDAGNVTNAGGELTRDIFESAIKRMFDNGAYLENVYVFVDSNAKLALTRIYNEQNGFSLPSTRTEAGINITTVLTDFCTVNIVLDPFIPSGKILIADMNYIEAVGLNTNGSNFYFEELANKGAAYQEMFYGNISLDYGPNFAHGAITGITYKQVAKPTVTPAETSQDITTGFNATLATTTSDAEIYYTLDGSTPTKASTKYTTQFQIRGTGPITLKARAFKAGLLDSDILSITYVQE